MISLERFQNIFFGGGEGIKAKSCVMRALNKSTLNAVVARLVAASVTVVTIPPPCAIRYFKQHTVAVKGFRPVRFSSIILTNKAVNEPSCFIRKGTSKQRQ